MKKLLLIFAFAMIFTEAAQAACASYTEVAGDVTRGIVEGVEHFDNGAGTYTRGMYVQFAQGYVGGEKLTCFSVKIVNWAQYPTLSTEFSIARETAEKALLSGFLFNNSWKGVSLTAP